MDPTVRPALDRHQHAFLAMGFDSADRLGAAVGVQDPVNDGLNFLYPAPVPSGPGYATKQHEDDE
jgi:hypothetical protein